MIGVFKIWSLDDGTLIIKCGFCSKYLIITKELLDKTRKNTVLGEWDREEPTDTKISDLLPK